MERCAIALVGWGTVGGGVVDILTRVSIDVARRFAS